MLVSVLPGSTLISCMLTVIVGLIIYRWLQNRKYNFPPGPTGWPLIGNLLQVDITILHKQVFEWSKKYGPVITLKLGSTKIVYINKIDAAMEVLVKKSTDFASRKLMPSLSVLTDGGKDITFGSYGPTWKLLRKIAVKALRSYMQGNALEKRIHDSVQTVLDQLDKRTGEFDPNEYYDFIFINMLNGFCFGGKYEYGDEEPINLLQQENELNDLFGNGVPEDFIPGLTYVCKSKTYRKLEYLQENGIVAFLKKKYQAARNSFDRDNLRHFCDHLILARLEAEEEGTAAVDSLTESHLIQALSDLFFGKCHTRHFTSSFWKGRSLALCPIRRIYIL